MFALAASPAAAVGATLLGTTRRAPRHALLGLPVRFRFPFPPVTIRTQYGLAPLPNCGWFKASSEQSSDKQTSPQESSDSIASYGRSPTHHSEYTTVHGFVHGLPEGARRSRKQDRLPLPGDWA